jgi:hypothetical protein
MAIKKTREHRFTYKDADGELRAVLIQVQHDQTKGEDRVKVQVASEHAPVEVEVFNKPALKRGRARTSSG